MNRIINILGIMAVVLVMSAQAAVAQTHITDDALTANATWSGKILIEKPFKVNKGVTLTVKPGTEIRLKKGACLNVEGVLKAVGSKSAPIVFTSDEQAAAPGDWQGINLIESGEGTALRHCNVSFATTVGMSVCSPEIRDCEIFKCINGVAVARKSQAIIKDNNIHDMTEAAVNCQMGATPLVTGNTIERCGTAVSSAQDAAPSVKNNRIISCGSGIALNQAGIPPIEGNTFKDNKIGIMLYSVSAGQVIRDNKISGSETAIVCQQFSNPLIEKNDISSNKEGIVCFRAASPIIKNNNVHDNERGIAAIQICTPKITANNIYSNKKGIYLDLSSYAIIHENNIYDNVVQIELGNMSSDWERKTNNKPSRGKQAQNQTMASRGKAPLTQTDDGADIMGFVDATENWWGNVTKEMNTKGATANIDGFIDYYDVPTRTYEGYVGTYVQDRIKYDNWRKTRNRGAGF